MRPIIRFNGAYLFSKSENSVFKILLHCPFWRDDFENRFFLIYSITTTKNVTKILNMFGNIFLNSNLTKKNNARINYFLFKLYLISYSNNWIRLVIFHEKNKYYFLNLFLINFFYIFSGRHCILLKNRFSKSSLQNGHSMRISKIEFALFLNKCAPRKRLIGFKWFLKNSGQK